MVEIDELEAKLRAERQNALALLDKALPALWEHTLEGLVVALLREADLDPKTQPHILEALEDYLDR